MSARHAPELEALRYPVGRFDRVEEPAAAQREGWVRDIEALPGRLREAVAGLDEERLDTPYRDGGWTVRQVVHHVPDSHINAYVRFCLAVTEDEPTLKLYDEKRWAELPFARGGPIEPSLAILDGLHARWVAMLRDLAAGDWHRAAIHPEHGRMTIDDLVNLYAWHSRHHVGHIVALRQRNGW